MAYRPDSAVTVTVCRLPRTSTIICDFSRYENQQQVGEEEAVDYPDFIRPAAEAVARGECERGIVLGGSGNGEAIVANRVPGVRCTLCWNVESARYARLHNDANVLSMGGRIVAFGLADEIVARPDLARVGGRYSDEWHVQHLIDPRAVSAVHSACGGVFSSRVISSSSTLGSTSITLEFDESKEAAPVA